MKKIKINKLPKGFHRMPDGRIMKDSDHKKMEKGGQPTLGPTPRAAANLEAEKGETVVTDLDNNNIPEHYKIGGKKHSEGGTPLNLPAKSFIFSDHKSMSLKGDDLKKFTNTSKKSMTPAAIASLKKFDISEENKVLKDKNADKMAKATAERNIQSKLTKLGELAMIQESKKDFEGGIPEIAMPYLNRNGITPEQVQMINAEIDKKNMMEEMAAYGKEMYGYGGRKYAEGGAYLPYPDNTGDLPVMYSNPNESGSSSSAGKSSGGRNQAYAPDVAEIFNKYGLSFDASNIGATSYKDVQSYKGDGMYGSAEENLEGFRQAFGSVYDGTDALIKSLSTAEANKSNPEVKKFQNWYTNTYIPNQAAEIAAQIKEVRGVDLSEKDLKALESGLKSEFGFGTGKTGFSIDGLMGTVTSSRRPLSYSIAPMPEEPDTTIPVEELTPYTPEDSKTDFYQQDMVKLAQKMGDRANRYFGYTQRLQPFLPDPTFLDPERELQANQEAFATAAATQGLIGRGQNLAGNLSLMQGKLAANQANTLAKYTNANSQIANQFELATAEAMNKVNEFNALQNRQQAIDTALTNQAYDDFKRQQRADIANLYANALTNRAETDLMNDLFPQYSIDPRTGGMGYFTGVGFVPGQDMTAFDNFAQQYLEATQGGPKTIEESKEAKYGGSPFKKNRLKKFMKR